MSAQPPEPPGDQPATGATPPPPAPPPPADAPSYGAPQAGGPYAGGPQPGGLLERFLARLIDGILVGIVNLVLIFVVAEAIDTYAVTVILSIITGAVSLGYFMFFENSRGQTIGKQFLKLQVVGPNGGNPTYEQSFRRNIFVAANLITWIPLIGLIVSLAVLVGVILIAVTINGDPVSRQGWHDRFAGGTRVIKL